MRPGLIHLLGIALVLQLASLARAAAPTTQPSPTAVITLNGEIDNYARDILFRHFAEAKAMGAKTVILELDTPGGLVTSALNIAQFLRAQDDLYIIAYVHHEAYSGGSMVALACNEIDMEPGAALGDCAPIIFSPAGVQSMGETERAKEESPVLSDFYASAQRNGYDPLLVSTMVHLHHDVYWVQSPDGKRKFVEEAEHKELLGKGWKDVPGVPVPVNRGTLLTVDAKLAHTLGLSKGTYETVQDLAKAKSLNILATLELTGGEEFVGWLGSAVVRAALIFVLLQALYIVFSHPGHGLAEAVAAIALAVLLVVPMMTGYASWGDITLIL
ncbi:MAG TPA: hypothetical protein VG722_10940, partial [Tepidisphaeraceae bacterium]|nr:hypothetical protein [Tepidisphaeraceae bacterium]